MELENQTQITIQNKVFTLGSPVTHANTLEQLLYVFQQRGIEGRPIVVINPVGDQLPDLANLLENYIENAMQGLTSQTHTTYMFQDATDEDIMTWAYSQYIPDSNQSLDYLIETGKAIRKQSRIKRQIDSAKAAQEEVWRRHCMNPQSDEGSAEYANLTYTVLPQLEAALNQVTQAMNAIPRDLDNGTRLPEKDNVENLVENVKEEPDSAIDNVENLVESVENDLKMAGNGKLEMTLASSVNMLMPLSVARNLANSPNNQVFKEQQSKSVPGYITVPLEYLIAYGVPLYADGVPIVFTKSGGFRRIGESSVSPVVSSYWYPKPRYATS